MTFVWQVCSFVRAFVSCSVVRSFVRSFVRSRALVRAFVRFSSCVRTCVLSLARSHVFAYTTQQVEATADQHESTYMSSLFPLRTHKPT